MGFILRRSGLPADKILSILLILSEKLGKMGGILFDLEHSGEAEERVLDRINRI